MNILKDSCIVFVSILLLSTTDVSAATIRLESSNTSAQAGSTVEIEVVADFQNEPPASFEVSVRNRDGLTIGNLLFGSLWGLIIDPQDLQNSDSNAESINFAGGTTTLPGPLNEVVLATFEVTASSAGQFRLQFDNTGTTLVGPNGTGDVLELPILSADELTINFTVSGEGEGEGEGEGDPIDPAQALLNAFEQSDSNNDNRLDFTEAQNALSSITSSQFNAMDTNGDGFLSEAELEGEQPCEGCNCPGKAGVLRAVKRHLGDFFLIGLVIVSLRGWGAGRR